MSIAELGWTTEREQSFGDYARRGLTPARVTRQDRASYMLWTAAGARQGVIAGRLRHDTAAVDIAVGDWVAVDTRSDMAVIHAVLPRTSTFARKSAGTTTTPQTIAANVDWLLLVSGLDGDFNPRRIERYLALAWNSGANPVIVLNKTDLCTTTAERLTEIETIAFGVPVHALSAATLEEDHALRPYLQPGATLAAVGSSGVGKSTLINALLGAARQRTYGVRTGDDRGRHTTTRRELFILPSGSVIIDTPGMRELQLWADESSVNAAFADIDSFADQCRFADCTHTHEPGCAVTAAAEVGDLDTARLNNYHKMCKEIQHLERKQDVRAQQEDKARIKALHREIRRVHKRKR